MGKTSSPAAAEAALTRSQHADVAVPAAENASVPTGSASAVNRLPSRLQRSPIPERTQSRFGQS